MYKVEGRENKKAEKKKRSKKKSKRFRKKKNFGLAQHAPK